ncbi:DUF6580 family putative transport protein [Sediminibacterium soli]|uniref:DUF6580 family putative transport protein n=1 Tax=Sediminibacterium soli TaxID=2698829 RepID=UPI00137968B7|nr:DUF6580 family putative transport protein [Sediminibacterium soli]NCI46004.1 hypothetical protein [Sediminibacterium soli]
MKINRSLIISLVLMVVVSALYRIMPQRPMGFAPQIAIGLFSGAIFVKDKKWAFAAPLISLLLSDLLYEAMYIYSNGSTLIRGFYDGQWINYLLFVGITCFGFLINTRRVGNVVLAALAAPTTYFLISNFLVWASNRGFGLDRPKTFNGLLLTYGDALPFFKNSVMATLVFSAVLFGMYYIVKDRFAAKEAEA